MCLEVYSTNYNNVCIIHDTAYNICIFSHFVCSCNQLYLYSFMSGQKPIFKVKKISVGHIKKVIKHLGFLKIATKAINWLVCPSFAVYELIISPKL